MIRRVETKILMISVLGIILSIFFTLQVAAQDCTAASCVMEHLGIQLQSEGLTCANGQTIVPQCFATGDKFCTPNNGLVDKSSLFTSDNQIVGDGFTVFEACQDLLTSSDMQEALVSEGKVSTSAFEDFKIEFTNAFFGYDFSSGDFGSEPDEDSGAVVTRCSTDSLKVQAWRDGDNGLSVNVSGCASNTSVTELTFEVAVQSEDGISAPPFTIQVPTDGEFSYFNPYSGEGYGFATQVTVTASSGLGSQTVAVSQNNNPLDDLPWQTPDEAGEDRQGAEACLLSPDPATRTNCTACLRSGATWTAIGCIDTTPEGVFTALLRIGIGVMGGVALFRLVLLGLYQYQFGTDAQIAEARQGVVSTLLGIVVVIFSVVILEIIGVNILDVVPTGFFT